MGRRVNKAWAEIPSIDGLKIIGEFWNTHENDAGTLARKYGYDMQQVQILLKTHLDDHFKQINQRVNAGIPAPI